MYKLSNILHVSLKERIWLAWFAFKQPVYVILALDQMNKNPERISQYAPKGNVDGESN